MCSKCYPRECRCDAKELTPDEKALAIIATLAVAGKNWNGGQKVRDQFISDLYAHMKRGGLV